MPKHKIFQFFPSHRTLLGFLMVLVIAESQAQFEGDNCSDPIVISSLPYDSPKIAPYSLCGMISNFSAVDLCNNFYTEGPDFVFKYRSTASDGCISLKLITTGALRFGLFITEGCPGPDAVCVAQAVNTNQQFGASRDIFIENVQLKPNTEYFFTIDHLYSGPEYCFDFELEVRPNNCLPIAAGSDCDNAIVINSIPYTNLGFNSCNNQDFINQGNECRGDFDENLNSAKDFVFRYSPKSNECIQLESKTPALSGMLSSFINCPYSNNSICLQKAIAYNGGISDLLSLEAGNDYYFVFSSDADLDTCTSFDLRIKPVSVVGANCSNPIVVSTVPFFGEDYLSTCMGDDFGTNAGCGTTYSDGDDMLFTYNSPGNECVSVSLYNKSNTNQISLAINSACPSDPAATCLVEQAGFSDDIIGVDYQVASPQTLYIVADRGLNSSDPFLLYDLSVASHSIGTEGVNCTTPLQINALPFYKAAISTGCKGRDYTLPCGSSAGVVQGNDYLMRFTASTTDCIRISATNVNGRGGFSLLSACPSGPSNCLGEFLCNTSTDSVALEYTVNAGTTYFLMAYSSSKTTDLSFDLNITYLSPIDTCTNCNDNVCSSCRNSGFEDMSSLKWTANYGFYDSPNQGPLTIDPSLNNTDSRAAIHSAGSYDQIIGPELKTVSPSGGNYSLRLGDPRVTGNIPGWSESATYSYKVDASSSNFYYYYAVVFEDPEHDVTDQPYFRVQMFDQNNASIPCGFYEASADGNIPGFKSSSSDFTIKWKDWTLVGVPLESYIGQTIRVEFVVKDCGLGGHFGYAYIDAACTQPLTVVNSKVLCGSTDSTTIVGPTDFAKYIWSTGDTTANIQVSDSGTYTLQAVNYGGCPINFTFTVKKNAAPSNIPLSDVTYCNNTNARLQAVKPNGPYTAGWDFGEGVVIGDTIQNTYSQSGTYIAEYVVRDSVCTYRFPHEFSIVANQFPTLPTDTICTGDSTTFVLNFADPSVTINWFDGSAVKTRTFSSAGNYPFTVTDGTCLLLDTASLTIVAPPAMSIGPDSSICENRILTLSPSGANYKRYTWSTGDTTSTIAINLAGEYSVLVDYGYCLLLDSMTLVVDTVPEFKLPNDTSLCGLKPYTISTGLNGSTLWQDNSTSSSYTILASGTYSATVTNNTCVYSDTIIVRVTPQHTVDPIPDSTLCSGDGYAVSVITNAVAPQFKWNDGNTNQSKTITTTGVHTIIVVDSSCTAKQSFRVRHVPRPTPNLGPDLDTCNNVSFSIDPGYFPNCSYVWNTGEQTQAIMVSQAGYYQVTVSTASCAEIVDLQVTTQAPPQIYIGPDTTICDGLPTEIDAFIPGSTQFVWSTGESTSSIFVTKGGDYSVVVTVPPCMVRDTLHLLELPSPKPVLQDHDLCPEDSVLLDASSPAAIYSWNTGSTSNQIYGRPGNGYSVVITNTFNCSITDTSTVRLAQTCPEFYVPNTFTPDGDGNNDFFKTEFFQVEIRLFQVFNRFGEIIFESRDFNPIWDGRYKGFIVKGDVYPWKVIYYTFDGTTHEKFGHVTVLR